MLRNVDLDLHFGEHSARSCYCHGLAGPVRTTFFSNTFQYLKRKVGNRSFCSFWQSKTLLVFNTHVSNSTKHTTAKNVYYLLHPSTIYEAWEHVLLTCSSCWKPKAIRNSQGRIQEGVRGFEFPPHEIFVRLIIKSNKYINIFFNL